MTPNTITAIIDGENVEIDLNQSAILCVTSEKNTVVELCIEITPGGSLLPFAQIKLYDDYRYLSAFKTLSDAQKLGDLLSGLFVLAQQSVPEAGTIYE